MKYNDIEKYIDAQLSDFDKSIPGLEKDLSKRLINELATLQLNRDGSIKRTAANFKKMLSIQRHLNDALIGSKYTNEVKKFFNSTGKISSLINSFYKETFDIATPNSLAKAIKDGSRNAIIDRMTNGLTGGLYDALQPILNDAVIAGQSYNSLADQIKEVVNGTSEMEGLISRYAKQIATDTLNGYAAGYHKAMQEGLGFQWYRYVGSNITTTRDFCIACKDRQYLHVSEFPKIIEGDFKEFKEIDGKIYERYGLPQGMRLGTNKDNFQIYRGGYNCGHQLRPVYEWQVPKVKRTAVYKTPAYKTWKKSQKGELI